MKTNSKYCAFILLVISLWSISCKTTDPTDDSYIPPITNSWTNQAIATHKFILTTPQVGVSRGAFTGTETYMDSAITHTLKGTFSNRTISFTVSREGRDTTYVGSFASDTLIDCGRLKIVRRN